MNKTKADTDTIRNFTSQNAVLKEFGLKGKEYITNIAQALSGLSANDAAKQLSKLSLNPNLQKDILKTAGNLNILQGSADDIAAALSSIGSAGATGIAQASSSLSGLGNILTGLVSNPLALSSALAAGAVAVIAIADAITVDYDEAFAKSQEANQNFADTKSSLAALNQEYQTNHQKIQQLQTLKANGTLTSAQSAELADLQSQNDILETQLHIKKQLLDVSAKSANEAGKQALTTGSTSLASTYDENGKKYDNMSKRGDMNRHGATDAQAIMESIDSIEYYQKELDKLQNKKNLTDSEKEEMDNYRNAIADLETDMASRANNISSIISGMTNKTSAAYKDARKALDAYNTRGMSKSDKEQQSMDTFFDMQSTDSLKNYFTELARAGKLTEESFSKFGFSAESFGVENLLIIITLGSHHSHT